MIKHIMYKLICVSLLFLCLFIYIEIPIIKFSEIYGPISIWIYPFITSDSKIIIFLMIGYIFIVSGNMKNTRTNYISDFAKRILLIILLPIIYFLLLYLLMIIPICRNLQFTFEWGKVIQLLASEGYGNIQGFIYIDQSIIDNYSASEATLDCILLLSSSGIFIGLFVELFKILGLNGLGILISYWFVYFQYFVSDFVSNLAIYFSPLSWLGLNSFSIPEEIDLSSAIISLILLSMLNLILILMIYIALLDNKMHKVRKT